MNSKKEKTEEEWKKELSPEEYEILRQKGTEKPFSGKYVDTEEKGTYKCRGCGQALFSSDSKFHSGSGWPSFDEALPGALEYKSDNSHGMERTEVVCSNCGSHLGHMFADGPAPTGKRLCINSICLELRKKKELFTLPQATRGHHIRS